MEEETRGRSVQRCSHYFLLEDDYSQYFNDLSRNVSDDERVDGRSRQRSAGHSEPPGTSPCGTPRRHVLFLAFGSWRMKRKEDRDSWREFYGKENEGG